MSTAPASSAPVRACRRPGCAGYAVAFGYCTAHQPAARAEQTAARAAHDTRRGSAHARGYDAKWAALSRHLRTLYPISEGYLTRTAFWTPAAAAAFHALRAAAGARREFLGFFFPGQEGAAYLTAHPIYEFHAAPRPEPAQVVDHIIPHHGDPDLFWAEWNLQTLSKRQHDEKTATFDGGFRGAKFAPSAARSQHRLSTFSSQHSPP